MEPRAKIACLVENWFFCGQKLYQPVIIMTKNTLATHNSGKTLHWPFKIKTKISVVSHN
jgi:hypothetical protein